jgi:hypothetical protein
MRYPKHIILSIKTQDLTKSSLRISKINLFKRAHRDTNKLLALFTTHLDHPLNKLSQRNNFSKAFLDSLKLSAEHQAYFDRKRAEAKAKQGGGLPKQKYATLPHSLLFSAFEIHFLRKEKIYTKLKYSRCPQYDIVSGGFAAIFAGFIGFLISEKFGIELVDSADFYNAFMYVVFLSLALRALVRVYNTHESEYNPFSLKYLLLFIQDFSSLVTWELKAACA